MVGDETWIKAYRKIIDNPIFLDAHLYQLYSYCLFKASYKEREILFNGEIVKLQPGQFITGRNVLALGVNAKPTTTYNRLQRLEKMKYLCLKSNNKNTLVTIANWDLYQSKPEMLTTNEQQNDNKMTTNEQQNDTNKKVKKVNKVNKNTYSDSVKMTDEQYEKLVERFGEVEAKDKIENLSLYINSKGDKYKCHYSTILTWDRKDNKSKPKSKAKVIDLSDRTQYTESGRYIGWKTNI